MAKVTIVIEDKGKRGEVGVTMEFDPSLKNTDTRATPAQAAAGRVLDALKAGASGVKKKK